MCVLIFWPIFFRAVSLTVVEAAAAVVLAQLPAHTRPSAHLPIRPFEPFPDHQAPASPDFQVCSGSARYAKLTFSIIFCVLPPLLVLCCYCSCCSCCLWFLFMVYFCFHFFYFLVSYPSPDQTRPDQPMHETKCNPPM